MALKGGTVFLLLCCAVLVTSLKIKSDPKIKDCARKLMRDCKKNGLEVPDMDALATVLGSDVPAEENSTPTTLLSMVESVLGHVFSGYKPSKIFNSLGKTGPNDISLPKMIQKMEDMPKSSACFVNAVAAPLAWNAVKDMGPNEDMEINEYETLLSTAKTVLKEKCVKGKLGLPTDIMEKFKTSLMSAMTDVYNQSSEEQRDEVMTWYKEQIKQTVFKCSSRPTSDSVKCNKSLEWLTGPNLNMLGPYLSELSENDIDFAPKQEFCDYFKSPQYKPIAKMKPSRARRLYNKCFGSEKDMMTYLDRLGPLSCYYEPSSQLTSDDSLKLLSALSNCDNRGLGKLKKKLMETATQNVNDANAYETFRQLGRGAKFLQNKMDKLLPLLNKDDLKKLMKDSSIDLTRKQKRVMLDTYLDDKKCGKLSLKDLEALTEVADQLPNCYYKNMNSAVFDDSDLLKNFSKKITKSQSVEMVKLLGKMTVTQMKDLPQLVQILPLRELENLKTISWDKFAEITWRPGQAKLLAKKMTEEVRDWYRISRSILQGVTCKMIEAVADSEAEEMSQSLADSPQWLSNGQVRCAARKLFATLESKRTDYFKAITEVELNNISSVFLIQLPPGKVKDLPGPVCPAFLNKMEMANLSSLPLNSRSRSALTERALSCLGPELSSLTTENVSKLGPLLCEVPPSKLRLLSPDVLRASLKAMTLCDYIPASHRKALVLLVNEVFGNPSTWTAADVEELGPLLVLYENTTYSLSKKTGMKDALSYLIQRLKNPPEILKKTLFELTLNNPSMPAARRKRASANSNGNGANITNTTDITVELIIELGLQNVYWTPQQLERINISMFMETVEVLGSVTNHSPQQLAVLSTKASQTYGPPKSMNETTFAELGCIAQGFTADELMKMAFSLRSLADVAKCGWNSSQIAGVWQGVSTNSNLTAPMLEASDMVALGGFMCGLSADEIKQLNTSSFTEAVALMNGLKCSLEVTQQFKNLTVAAFGSPDTWTAAEVSDLGTFIAGLDATEFASLNVSVFQHISKYSIPLIPPQNFAALSLDQIEALGPDNAGMVTAGQKAAMTAEQLGALTKAIEGMRQQTMQSENSAPPLVTHSVAAFTKPLLFALLGLALL